MLAIPTPAKGSAVAEICDVKTGQSASTSWKQPVKTLGILSLWLNACRESWRKLHKERDSVQRSERADRKVAAASQTYMRQRSQIERVLEDIEPLDDETENLHYH